MRFPAGAPHAAVNYCIIHFLILILIVFFASSYIYLNIKKIKETSLFIIRYAISYVISVRVVVVGGLGFLSSHHPPSTPLSYILIRIVWTPPPSFLSGGGKERDGSRFVLKGDDDDDVMMCTVP